MSKIPFILLFAALVTACGNPQSTSEAADTTLTTTEDTVEVATESAAEEAQAAYVTSVIQADLPSPRKEMVTTIGDATVTINYGSPSVKGRELWGALVPYNEVWRTGANEATTFTTDQDLELGDKTLPAGTYGLFTVPSEKQWVIVFNETSDQWGAYEYDETADILRVTTTPMMVEQNAETMEFLVKNDTLMLAWGKLRLPFPLS